MDGMNNNGGFDQGGAPVPAPKKKIPGILIGALVTGIIGAVFAFVGGLCAPTCAAAVSILSGSNLTWLGYLLGFGGAAIAIAGAALSLKNGKIAGILMLVSAVMSIVMIIIFFMVFMIFCVILLIVGGVLAIVGGIKQGRA